MHRDILRRHWPSLRDDLEIEELLPHLVNVLTQADQEKVKAEATRRDKIDKLLEILPRKGPEAFDNFLKALQKIQPFLSALIQDTGKKYICRFGLQKTNYEKDCICKFPLDLGKAAGSG